MSCRSHLVWLLVLFFVAPLVACWSARAAEEKAVQDKRDPKVTALLERMVAFQQKVKSLRFKLTMNVHVEMGAMTTDQTTVYAVQMKRPNKIAMELKKGLAGATVVCDGKQLFTYMPSFKKYMVADAPPTLDDLMKGKQSAMHTGMLWFGAPLSMNTEVIKDSTGSQYVGKVDLDGVTCHRVRLFEKNAHWDMWVATGDRPLTQRVEIDMSPKIGGAAQQKKDTPKMKMSMSIVLSDYEVDVEIPDDQFVFSVPEGATKVESFMDLFSGLAGGAEEEGPHPLVGKAAPDFELKTLEDQTVQLASHKGKDVVILDFWATWCGPCVRAMPTIAGVAKQYQDKGVVFYAVNLREPVEKIRKFLEEKQLDVTVLRDEDGSVGQLYEARAIPQTVLIGKDGTVQVVHVGLLSDLETRLTEELDALLKGENLAEKARREREKPPEAVGLEHRWSVPGRWAAAAALSGSEVCLVDKDGNCVAVDPAGKEQRRWKIQDAPVTMLRRATLSAGGSDLLSFSTWGRSLKAHDAKGTLLWQYSTAQGIDDAWPVDLDGDGRDEVVIGHNGRAGVHVVDHRGKLLWKYTGIGNVWHVCGGDVDGDGQPEVVTTSAVGQVHLFSPDGQKIRDLQTSCYANMVRLGKAADGKTVVLVVGESTGGGLLLVALDSKGNQLWSLDLTGRALGHIDSAQMARARPWLAVGLRGGKVCVVDITTGKQIAHATGQGQRPQVAWLEPAAGPPLLVVATGGSASAFQVAK